MLQLPVTSPLKIIKSFSTPPSGEAINCEELLFNIFITIFKDFLQ